jgi:hypothetical protein
MSRYQHQTEEEINTKHYESDWAKAKARDLLSDVIERTLLKFKKPRDLRVLCFPGIDATEIIQIYDKLGIPRSNITGLERDKQVYEAIEEENHGINLIHRSFEDYIQDHQKIDFDVVSLDFIGPYTFNEHCKVHELVRKQRARHFVYHQANLASRDKCSYDFYKSGLSVNERENESLPKNPILRIFSLEKLFERKRPKKIDLETKGKGFSRSIRASLRSHTYEEYTKYSQFFIGKPPKELIGVNFKDLNYENLSKIHQTIESMNPRYARILSELMDGLNNKSLFSIFKMIIRKDESVSKTSSKIRDQAILEIIKEEINQFQEINDTAAGGLYNIICNALVDGIQYHIKDAERYSYISESGVRMLGDVYFLKSDHKAQRIESNILSHCNYPGLFKIKGEYRYKKIEKEVKKLTHKDDSCTCTFCQDKNISKRQYLGNSAKPVITESRAKKEFESGSSIEDVKKRYRLWRKKPLKKWKKEAKNQN